MNDVKRNFGQKPGPPVQIEAHDGILLVDKPSGPTSHDVVDKIRKRFRFRKVGHGGTLDPQATGLLIILLGKGTKLSNRIIASDKVYQGVMRLGISTDSHDSQGKVLQEADWSHVTKEQLEDQIKKFTGDMYQTPPMVSAVKVNGVPLYKSARKGKVVERKARLIHVYEFKLLEFTPPDAGFLLRCTKGTYVRSLCSDIGDALGCGACLTELRRTRCGDFKIEDALACDNVIKMERDELVSKVIPMEKLPAYCI
ncbi:tRNA pseudouridine(55) synthase TruB [Verrucomicrobiota bacterium]